MLKIKNIIFIIIISIVLIIGLAISSLARKYRNSNRRSKTKKNSIR